MCDTTGASSSVRNRVVKANNEKADMYISVHHNQASMVAE